MIATFSIFMLSAMSVAFLNLSWLFICNERTSKQRIKIVDYVYGGPEGPGAMDRYTQRTLARNNYKDVSYDKHMLTLFLFQNYEKLYPEIYKKGGLS